MPRKLKFYILSFAFGLMLGVLGSKLIFSSLSFPTPSQPVHDSVAASNSKSLRKARGSSLASQALAIETFTKKVKANPGSFGDFYDNLRLPAKMRKEISLSAICLVADSDLPLLVDGAEKIRDAAARESLLGSIVGRWAKADAKAAFDWSLGAGHSSMLMLTVGQYWRANSSAASQAMQNLSKEQRPFFVAGLVSTPNDWSPEASVTVLSQIEKLRTEGSHFADPLRGQFLEAIVESNPDTVEVELERSGSDALRDRIAPLLAITRSNGDWEKALNWLTDYEGAVGTPAGVSLWNKWIENDREGVKKFLENNSDPEQAMALKAYILAGSGGSEDRKWLQVQMSDLE